MSTGKYSPTVVNWYSTDQNWFDKNLNTNGAWYDKDGYDSYGYHQHTGKDRAGWREDDYMQLADDVNTLYDEVYFTFNQPVPTVNAA